MSSYIEYVIQPDLSEHANCDFISGNYYLIGFSVKLNCIKAPYWVIKLADGAAELTVYCFQEESFFEKLQPEAMFYFMLQKGKSSDTEIWECTFAERAKLEASMFCLPPVSWALHPAHLTRLSRLIDLVHNSELRLFLFEVLSDKDITKRFLSCPASLKYHHNYVGGLLLHSIEVAEHLAWNSSLSDTERQQAVVAGLMHDIGKIVSLTPDMKRTALGSLVDHDDLTLYVCANALKRLETQDKRQAELLMHAWTCNSANTRYGYPAFTNVAKALQIADRRSADNSLIKIKATVRLPADAKSSFQLQYSKQG